MDEDRQRALQNCVAILKYIEPTDRLKLVISAINNHLTPNHPRVSLETTVTKLASLAVDLSQDSKDHMKLIYAEQIRSCMGVLINKW